MQGGSFLQHNTFKRRQRKFFKIFFFRGGRRGWGDCRDKGVGEGGVDRQATFPLLVVRTGPVREYPLETLCERGGGVARGVDGDRKKVWCIKEQRKLISYMHRWASTSILISAISDIEHRHLLFRYREKKKNSD
jgi:hypothetical protein